MWTVLLEAKGQASLYVHLAQAGGAPSTSQASPSLAPQTSILQKWLWIPCSSQHLSFREPWTCRWQMHYFPGAAVINHWKLSGLQFFLSQFWRPQAWNQVVGRPALPLKTLRGRSGHALLLAASGDSRIPGVGVHHSSPCLSSRGLLFCLLEGRLALDLGLTHITQNDLISRFLVTSTRSPFPNKKSHWQVPGIRKWTHLFGSHCSIGYRKWGEQPVLNVWGSSRTGTSPHRKSQWWQSLLCGTNVNSSAWEIMCYKDKSRSILEEATY